jgi:hypothetical protein
MTERTVRILDRVARFNCVVYRAHQRSSDSNKQYITEFLRRNLSPTPRVFRVYRQVRANGNYTQSLQTRAHSTHTTVSSTWVDSVVCTVNHVQLPDFAAHRRMIAMIVLHTRRSTPNARAAASTSPAVLAVQSLLSHQRTWRPSAQTWSMSDKRVTHTRARARLSPPVKSPCP